jgi:hypothetical protein
LDNEVVSNSASSPLERKLIEVNKEEVVERISTMNKGVSLSCDDLLDDENIIVPETLISLSSCVEVKNEVPLYYDIELPIQAESDFSSNEERILVVVISKQREEFSNLVTRDYFNIYF